MGFRYAVIGAGRQGTAAAYDLAAHGNADSVVLADVNLSAAKAAAKRVNDLAVTSVAIAAKVDVRRSDSVLRALKQADVFISAVPYRFNLQLAKWAIAAKVGMVDLGGHTGIVRKQLALGRHAKRAGVALVPDCGMGPGANVNLAMYAMSLVYEPQEVRVYDGGLPQHPKPPWNYALLFNVEGLTNEYAGTATFLRDGKRVEVPALSEPEEVVIPSVGRLEAFVTSGGLSTMPWAYEGVLRVLENKTLRYPGHLAQMRVFADLGFLSEEAIEVQGRKVAPRRVLNAALERALASDDIRDVAVTRVVARGRKDGHASEAIVDLIDFYDETTGFRAMERLTGWHAALVAAMIARGELPPGAHAVHALPPNRIVDELRARGFQLAATVA